MDGAGPRPGTGESAGPAPGTDPHESLLTSKITVPALPSWAVRRERIERLIGDGSRGPLTVVTGPPGAGKTMALAWWAATTARAGPIAWVTLDRFDNRPEILWSYIGESLRRSGAAVPAELNPAGRRPPGQELVQLVASVLAAQDPPVALVLDDIHMLTDPAALDGLSYVLRNARAGLHLLVAARMDPLLPLHRYRLTGELTEIRAADLAFSAPEALALMAQHGVTLPPESLEVLTRKNEGWAAGLRLAAMSMEGHPAPERLVTEFGARQSAVTGYFVKEVLNAQPPDVRNVLLKTSILDRVTPALAGELAGDGHAEAVIPRLAEANAFVQPLGGDWYRYHPLLAEVLRLKLRRERPEEVPRLNQRAAAWLHRNGMLAEAVKQLTAVGQWRLASRMAVEDLAVGRLIDPRACATLAEAFRKMPAAGESADPPILIVRAAMRLRDLDDQACAAWLRRAERALARLPGEQELPSRLAVSLIHADMARRGGDIRAVKAAVAEVGGVLARIPDDVLSRRPLARAQLAFLRGAVEMWAGHLDDAAEILDEATTAVDGAHGCADCAEYWALLEAIQGRLGLAAGLARPATAASAVPVPPTPNALLAWPDRLISAVTGLVATRHGLPKGREPAAVRTARSVRQAAPDGVRPEERLIEAALGCRGGNPALDQQPRGGNPAPGQHASQEGLRPEPARSRLTIEVKFPTIEGHEPDSLIVEELSDREQEVLRYVSGMLSTAEVAKEMYISVNTVKSHLKSIFRKLGASRRGEAVRLARHLELI